ncbi:hypothetical protein [Sulfitobacter guttiformis]|uniref:Uncharacterized protein n=1 Tax=Sulfitobacter guttiformis TaxID=74349 RepID=A0A420DHB3_9RHOB|nr:hypothetical protein [Sulfitobacter guttiformis]KIN72656.1 hypothetical protein Z949_1834 [Sulfitobacter guttiformis KCTC 32187]RKE93614.1 hypothetical protein C8N30_2691 [Sulfitobacter guttiformis]
MKYSDRELLARLRKAEVITVRVATSTVAGTAEAARIETPSYIRTRIRRPDPRVVASDVARVDMLGKGPDARLYIAPDRLGGLVGREYGTPARRISKPVAPEAMDAQGRLLPKFQTTGASLEALTRSGRYFVGKPRGAKMDYEGIFERRGFGYKTMVRFQDSPARRPSLGLKKHWRETIPGLVERISEVEIAKPGNKM